MPEHQRPNHILKNSANTFLKTNIFTSALQPFISFKSTNIKRTKHRLLHSRQSSQISSFGFFHILSLCFKTTQKTCGFFKRNSIQHSCFFPTKQLNKHIRRKNSITRLHKIRHLTTDDTHIQLIV